MFKKWDFFILLALLLVIAALLPVSANDLNVTDGGLEAQNSEIITVDDSSDILGQNGEASIGDTVYFDASAASDGNGSKENPFKYLTPERIASGTAYFAEGTYYLNETCTFSNSKLVGESVSETIIMSLAGNSYDFIIPYNSSLEMESLYLEDFNILNQGTLKANNMFFEGNDVFDVKNPPEIQNGSGYFDSSFGGVIVCDTPYDIMNTLVLKGCQFQYVFDAFNGGAIAAINSNITIIDSWFTHYSATYKGGAIYCEDSIVNMSSVRFDPYTVSEDAEFSLNHYGSYTAYYGGSVYCEYSDVLMDDVRFTASSSFSFGGCIASINSNVEVTFALFKDSMSLTDGGGAIYSSKGRLKISNVRFENNSAEFGGAVCNINSALDSHSCVYLDNWANHYGGAIYDIYGTLDLVFNSFYRSHAQAGGSIYSRIPNNFNLNANQFSNSTADDGPVIFLDGKDSADFASYLNDFSTSKESYSEFYVFAEFTATFGGTYYSTISNPLYYQLSEDEGLHFPDPAFEVFSNGVITMRIYDSDDASRLTSVLAQDIIRNITAEVEFGDMFENPVLTFYLLAGENKALLSRESGDLYRNLYGGSRDALFDGYEAIGMYSMDLNSYLMRNERELVESCTMKLAKDQVLDIRYNNLYEANSFYPVSLINNTFEQQPAVLSAYYNSNDLGLVSSVKNQKAGGNCWAFSGLATLETCLKKATGITYDFSEENAKNLMAAYSVFGLRLETNHAGYDTMLMSYLTSWLGPVDESIEDYDDYSSISLLLNPMFHIQNIKFLPVRSDSKDNDMYKMAIRDYGAISVTFRWGKDYHAVSLVGWDDDYVGYDAVGNYAHGAWIFKNSYGEEWGDNGFGYLSYEQKLSEQIDPGMHAYTFIFDDINPYTKIYQYDFGGVSQFYKYKVPIYFKNKFTAENDSILSAFSTYFDRESNYTVSVYVNDKFIYSQDGTSSAGYYTIPLNAMIQLDAGDEFSIVVNNHNDGYNCIPLCSAEDITKKTFSTNVSFFSFDGENWFDLYEYANSCHVACIKAFTQNVDLTEIRIKANEFGQVNTSNFNVKVTVDDFDAVGSINYCLVKFIVDGEIYYAQIKNGIATLNLNLGDGQHSLSAQYKDNVFESNVVSFSFTVDSGSQDFSFNALQDILNNAPDNSIINLEHDYFFDMVLDDGEYGVRINRPVTINGNGHVIDARAMSTTFSIRSDNVVLNDITFANARSANGGAIYIAARNVTLNGCSIINSSADQYGGGIYSLFDVELNGCRFTNNSAALGGGLYLIGGSATHIDGSCFEGNTAGIQGSAIYMTGIGNVAVSSTNFTNNNATYSGGAVFTDSYYSNFTECVFSNNSASSGGAVFSSAVFIDFNGCTFLENIAERSAGAIITRNTANVRDCKFIANSVNNSNDTHDSSIFQGFGGAAIYSFDNLNVYGSTFIENYVKYYGGALFTSKYLNVYSCDFIDNIAKEGGGAIFNNEWQISRSNLGSEIWAVHKFTESHCYDSNFINNTASSQGGAIYSSNLVRNCTFINNRAVGIGGAISEAKSIYSSRFINNSANYAGAVFYHGKVPFYSYDSVFINNSAINGGALYAYSNEESSENFISNVIVHNNTFIDNFAVIGSALYAMGELNLYDSIFSSNSAEWGGCIYSGGQTCIYSCRFTANSALRTGGVIYTNELCFVDNSSFTDNFASAGGAIYSFKEIIIFNSLFANNFANHSGGVICSFKEIIISNSAFANNSANYFAGAIYSSGECSIVDSSFDNNSAQFGGAIFSDGEDQEYMSNIYISSTIFSSNTASESGGAIYSKGNTFVVRCGFESNAAGSGGAFYLPSDGDYFISDSSFTNNSAGYGGAIFSSYSDSYAKASRESRLCNFTANSASSMGGVIYSIGRFSINESNFVENTAQYGSAILSRGYLDLRDSHIKASDDAIPIEFLYWNGDGNMYMKGNLIDSKSYGIYIREEMVPSDLPLKLVFTNASAVKGQLAKLCGGLEDSDGNLIVAECDLYLELTDHNGNIIKRTVIMDYDLEAFFIDTFMLPSAVYSVIARIQTNDNGSYVVGKGTLTVEDEANRTFVSIKSGGLTKEYGKSNKLTVTVKDINGNVIAGTYVYVELEGEIYSLKTNSKGQVTINANFAPGKYVATIEYSGSDSYVPATKSVNVVVKKATPKITASKKTFKSSVKTKLYKVTLKDSSGKAMKYVSLKIKVNGKTYSAKTNGKGVATFKITKLTKIGSFKATITYAGNSYYNKVTKTVTITVKK